MNFENLELLLGKRRFEAYKLREQGLTFKDVGLKMGVHGSRARDLYCSALMRIKYGPSWDAGLSVRASNVLNNFGVNSKEEALQKYLSGELVPNKSPRNWGWKCHRELARWLGVDEPKKKSKHSQLKTCPHCGENLEASKG